MTLGDERTRAAAQSKAMNKAKHDAMVAAVLKYADGERTREDVMRMSGAGKTALRNLELEHGLKFGRAR